MNAYERNRRGREACLRHYGRSCAACGFNFETNYGETMDGYFHVHHVIPIAQVRAEYLLHPINDLRPVCANLPRRDPSPGATFFNRGNQRNAAKRPGKRFARKVKRRPTKTRMPTKSAVADAQVARVEAGDTISKELLMRHFSCKDATFSR